MPWLESTDYSDRHARLPGTRFDYWRIGRPFHRSRWFDSFLAQPLPAFPGQYNYLLKTIRTDLNEVRRVQAIDRLTRRVMANESVSHQGIIPLLDAGLDRPPFFVVEPFVTGSRANDWVEAAGGVPVSRLLWIIRQVAEIASASHERNRAHLAISFEHLIVGWNGRASLVGWSQSHAFDQKVWVPIESVDQLRFLAPELLDKKWKAHGSADVYALGVLMYTLFSGRYPFGANDFESLVDQIRFQIPEDLSALQSACPDQISSLVKQMIAKNPMRRPTAKTLVDKLISIEIDHLHDNRHVQWTP